MYLLDTNVISELRKSGTDRLDPYVRQWAQTVAADDLFISVVTLTELEIGVLSLERKDPTQGAHLRTWLDHYVKVHFHGRILDITAAVALQFAKMNVPDRVAVMDGLIAATAQVHNMMVVTRNVADFSGVAAVNPFQCQL
ncbi:type II toxin-antitoxin system VapC family toxin [Alkalimonas amylolytica]|uniref:PIN domain-containing protein n=1 Tax=Alkalimonas amylolytica TaxID=152573 RepID=A0A1H3ZZ24_ALKAM|nr:type II toxin-antitoxin system VapC family toxin [Alkalimonas amylolytica]SEA29129.1 hypothetical protein SAMN04488051_102432 [Alkalimonas amylolytica]